MAMSSLFPFLFHFQIFDVTVTLSPIVQIGFGSVKEAMGHYVAFNCSVSGNPKPKIKWYRNGRRLDYGSIISYVEPELIIQTFEEYHKGIYQCFAANDAGEAQVTGLLSWENKDYMRRPENVKCYPINYSTIKVTFEIQQRVNKQFSNENFNCGQLLLGNALL